MLSLSNGADREHLTCNLESQMPLYCSEYILASGQRGKWRRFEVRTHWRRHIKVPCCCWLANLLCSVRLKMQIDWLMGECYDIIGSKCTSLHKHAWHFVLLEENLITIWYMNKCIFLTRYCQIDAQFKCRNPSAISSLGLGLFILILYIWRLKLLIGIFVHFCQPKIPWWI